MSLIHRASLIVALSAGAFRDAINGDGAPASSNPAPVPIPPGMRAETFSFRKETIKSPDGTVLSETPKHPMVTIPLPVAQAAELHDIFSDPARTAEQKFLIDLIGNAFYAEARDQINDAREINKENKGFRVSANVIDYSKLTILALANRPDSERSNKITDEDMKLFLSDYLSVMPAAVQKPIEKIKAQVDLLEKKLATVKTDRKILPVMEGMLSVWAVATTALEDHQQVYEMLTNRIKKWMETAPRDLMGSIT